MVAWTVAAPAIASAFAASLVEAVEAFTIVLAVGVTRGWRPALAGTAAGLLTLAALVALLGPALALIPLRAVQLVIGLLLLGFGLRWLVKAVRRAAGTLVKHDEAATFAEETEKLAHESKAQGFDLHAAATTYQVVMLEGVEVVFIVLAVGVGRGLIWPASAGALAAVIVVLIAGLISHRPLSRVPENTLKFAVGVMLTAFGVFWTGEGVGVRWPGRDLSLGLIAATALVAALGAVQLIRRQAATTSTTL